MRRNLQPLSELRKKWQDLGFPPHTFRLALLVPPVQTAWAEGFLQRAERRRILEFAETEVGIAPGGAEYAELENWLDTRPTDETFARASEFLDEWLGVMPPEEVEYWSETLMRICFEVAHASPEIGLLRRERPQIHRDERRQIEEISRRLGIATVDMSRAMQ